MKEFEYENRAMGTKYSIAVVCNSEKLALRMFELGKADIQTYEAQFSRFQSESELSRLNRNRNMNVSRNFLDVVHKSRELFNKTKGIFNPLVQIERLGYDINFSDMKKENVKVRNAMDPYNINFSETIIDKKNSLVHLTDGQKLDYGGFLKGYLAEIIARKIKNYSKDITGVVVNLGGDIFTLGLDENGKNFVFNIYNPITKKDDIEVILNDQSLATSGTYKRSWSKSGKKFHHILDISGEQNPNNSIISASVVHKDGASAEAFTKVFLSVGPKRAIKLLSEESIRFVIIKNDGQIIKNI